ncbi:MAG: PVC-type heme-binding CxxCH protein [Chthoniobacteraceae bacterium]
MTLWCAGALTANLVAADPAAALASFETAPDIVVELVAAEPLVTSPCAMAFDDRGRIYVVENRGYPSTASPPQGSIALLEDTDGDGRMDQRTVFADGLTFPNGVLPWRDGVFVSCAPDVLFLRDTDGDGRADERRVVLTGFDTKQSTQLRVNDPTLGPDGWIYLASGLSGGRITAPDHPEFPALELKSDLRFHPETGRFEAIDGRGQYGQSFDEWGNRFICMNRIQVQHVVLPSAALRRNSFLAFSDTVQNCPELVPNTFLHGGGGAARIFPVSNNITTADSHAGTFSAACAVHIWNGRGLPARYHGCAFSCDPTGNLVHVDRLIPRGSTFAAEPLFDGREFLASRDDWFRPVFLATGPEGALYICDMTRKIIEHPDYLPEEMRKRLDFSQGRDMGRIWRVKGTEAPIEVKPRPVPAGIQRIREAIALGENQDPTVVARLAEIGQGEPDRWLRSAIVGSAAGREDSVAGALLESKDRGFSVELLTDLARVIGRRAAAENRPKNLDDLLAKAESAGFAASAALAAGWSEGARIRLDDQSKPIKSLIAAARSILEAPNESSERQELSVRVLARVSWGSAGEALIHAVKMPEQPKLREAAVRALAAFDGDEAAEALMNTELWERADPLFQQTILTSLLGTPAHVEHVVAALEHKRIPLALVNSVQRRQLLSSKDSGLRARAEKLFPSQPTGDRGAAFERAKAALNLPAQAANGRLVFQRVCASCHRLEREGHAVGPDLFDIRNQPKESILLHIVVPEHEIAPSFAAYIAETKDGRGLAGILTSETDESITLRAPGGIEETLLRSDLTSLTASPQSLMPAGLEQTMTMPDLADLLGYLRGEGPEVGSAPPPLESRE